MRYLGVLSQGQEREKLTLPVQNGNNRLNLGFEV